MRLLVVDGSVAVRLGLVRLLGLQGRVEIAASDGGAPGLDDLLRIRRPDRVVGVGEPGPALAAALRAHAVPYTGLPERLRDELRRHGCAGPAGGPPSRALALALALAAGVGGASTRAPADRIPGAAAPRPRDDDSALVPLDTWLPTLQLPPRPDDPRVVCIGASAGGTRALESLFRAFPPDLPGVVVVQHMPAGFTRAFAKSLDAVSRLAVCEAEHGMPVEPGAALVAPGGKQVLLARAGRGYRVEVVDGPRVQRHRPSVDVLFRSALNVAGARAVGVLLTGMGSDGARGLLDLRTAGAYTIAQDEATSFIFGMPGTAIAMGGATVVLPLGDIPVSLQAVTRLPAGADPDTAGWAHRPALAPRPAPHLPGSSRLAVRPPQP